MKAITIALVMLFALALAFAFPAAAQTEQPPVNLCSGSLRYSRPPGWVLGERVLAEYGAILSLSSKATTDDPPLEGEAEATLFVYVRQVVTEPSPIDPNSSLDEIVAALMGRLRQPVITSEIETLTVDNRPAAVGRAFNRVQDLIFYAIELHEDVVGVVAFDTPLGESGNWEDTILELAESFQYIEPEVREVEGAAPLSQLYATDECILAFAYPEGWTLAPRTEADDPRRNVIVGNFDEISLESFTQSFSPGQAAIRVSTIRHDGNDDMAAYLETYVDALEQREHWVVVEQEVTTINDTPAIRVVTHVDNPGGAMDVQFIVLLPDGLLGATVALFTAGGELDQWDETALAVAESVGVNVGELE